MCCPDEGWVKCNVDAGVEEEWGTCLGLVYRDGRGSVLWCASNLFLVVRESMIAEAMAIRCGLALAKSNGIRKVVMKGDNLDVINALKSREAGASIFHLIIEDILCLVSSFESVVWSFVRRSGNKAAHSLAHFRPSEVGEKFWDTDFPTDVLVIARFDLLI